MMSAQAIRIVFSERGPEAVLLPIPAEDSVRVAHVVTAAKLLPQGVVAVELGREWGAVVLCTLEFESHHRAHHTHSAPAATAFFFAHA